MTYPVPFCLVYERMGYYSTEPYNRRKNKDQFVSLIFSSIHRYVFIYTLPPNESNPPCGAELAVSP